MIAGGKIFVVDDDQDLRQAVCALLQSHGYCPEAYATADEFLASANLNSPGVLIADLALPGVTGEQLLQRLVAEQSPITTIVLTGAADVKAAVRLMESGALTLLQKPFEAGQLLSALDTGLRRTHARDREIQERKAALAKLNSLSEEEREVLKGMITGRSIKLCSVQLHLSTRTIERKRKIILEKLGVASIPEVAVFVERATRDGGGVFSP